MPYIKQEKRKDMDEIIKLMEDKNVKVDGDLNYILFKYCLRNITPTYNNYKNYIGELRQCCSEIERRMLNPYEDEKIKFNGDI